MNVNPRSLPNQQYFSSDKARYNIHMTRNAAADKAKRPTGREDIRYQIEFSAPDGSNTQNASITTFIDGRQSNSSGSIVTSTLANRTSPIYNSFLLEPGKLMIRPAIAYASATDQWVRGDEKIDSGCERNIYFGQVTTFYGFNRYLQIDGFLSYFHPGQTSLRSPVFLSSNNFSQMLGLGSRLRFYNKNYGLSLQALYEFAIQGYSEPRIKLDFRNLWYFSNFSIGPGFHLHYGLDGIDVLSTEFNNSQAQFGVAPLDRKQERALHLGVFANYRLDAFKTLEAHYSRTVTGENTGLENIFSFGIGLIIN